MNEEVKVRKCPFCDSDAVVVADNTRPNLCTAAHAFVRCLGCHTDGPDRDTVDQAIAAWNTRSKLEITEEDVERAARAISAVVSRHGAPCEGEEPDDHWEGWIDEARASIAAFLEGR